MDRELVKRRSEPGDQMESIATCNSYLTSPFGDDEDDLNSTSDPGDQIQSTATRSSSSSYLTSSHLTSTRKDNKDGVNSIDVNSNPSSIRQNLPGFKDQMYSIPQREYIPEIDEHISETHRSVAERSIPMAEAFVVPQDEPNSSDYVHVVQITETSDIIRRSRSATHPRERNSPENTTTTTTTTATYTVDDRIDSPSPENTPVPTSTEEKQLTLISAVKSERQFWVRVIVIVICSNTLLVAGVVSAAFCAIGGSCRREEKPQPAESDTVTIQGMGDVDPVLGSTIDDEGDEERPVSTTSLIIISVVVEFFIVIGLVIYYRRWKRSRSSPKVTLDDTCNLDSVT